MKKTNKVLASAAATSALALLMSTTAFAAVPTTGGTVVLGNKAYSLDYLATNLTSAQIADITTQLGAAGNNVFFKLGATDTAWTSLIDGTTKVTDVQLAAITPTVTYIDKNGTASTQQVIDNATLTANVTATGAKTLKVTFNAPVDTTKAVVAVKKGTVAVNTDSVTFADDKMSATITTTTKLSAGDYTVSVSGLTTTPVTATVTAADEKVSKINITSANAPRLAADNTQALVAYEVLNQYGEKMIGQNITWTISTGVGVTNDIDTTGNGSFQIKNAGTADFIPGATVYITGVNAATGTVVNGQVQIALASQADSVSFKGVYDTVNSKLVDLPAGFANGRYVLLLRVNDQYGNAMSAPDLSKLVFTSNNPLFVGSTFTTASDVTIDGVTYKAINLTQGTTPANGGSVTIQAISTITGKTSTFTTQAQALGTVKTFSMSAPTTMIAEGETVEIPFTAVDQYGSAVTDYTTLNSSVTLSPAYGAGPSGLKFVKQDDGSAKLYFTAPATGASTNVDLPVYVTSVVTNGGNFSSLMLNVKDSAVPSAIIGLDSTSAIPTDIAKGNSVVITPADLDVQDQYGRIMADSKVKAWLDASSANSIVVASDATTGTPFSVGLNGGSDSASDVLATDTDSVTLTALNQTAASETLTFTLATGDNGSSPIAASAKAITFTKVEQSSYVSYVVADLGKMYNDGVAGTATAAAYNKTLKVYGVEANGTKVLLPNTDYTVTTDGKLAVTGNTISDKTSGGYDDTSLAYDLKDANGNYTDATVNVLVTVNDSASGSAIAILPKTLVVSAVAPKVATVTLNPDYVTDGKAFINPAAGAISTLNLTSSNFIYSVADQYGVADAEAPVVTITNLTKVTGSTFTVTGNGTNATAITGATLGDKFTATYKFASGVSVTVNFTVGL